MNTMSISKVMYKSAEKKRSECLYKHTDFKKAEWFFLKTAYHWEKECGLNMKTLGDIRHFYNGKNHSGTLTLIMG